MIFNIKNPIEPAAYVVETGTDNNWTYHKYSDGTFKAWKTENNTYTFNSAMGSLYRSAEYTLTLPSFSVGLEFLHGECNGQQWVIFTDISTPKWCIVSSTSATNQSRYIRFFIVGKWA